MDPTLHKQPLNNFGLIEFSTILGMKASQLSLSVNFCDDKEQSRTISRAKSNVLFWCLKDFLLL